MKAVNIPLAIVILSILGFLLIISQVLEGSRFKISAREMHQKVMNTDYELDRKAYEDLQSPVIIDIRDREHFILSNETNVRNIPLAAILDEENLKLFEEDKPKVILSHDPVHTHELWMLLTQMGIKDLYVMDPGILAHPDLFSP